MSNPVDLSHSFQSLGLREDRLGYHALTLDYPVLDFVHPEAGNKPCLRQPLNIEFREQPDASRYHIHLTGTDFIIRIPVTSDSSPTQTNLAQLSLAIQNLHFTPGNSILQIGSYSSPSDGDSHLFRLLTESPVNGQYETVAQAEFSSIEWEAERTALQAEKWTRLADNLINRSSDRAYLHVHEKLRPYSWYQKLLKAERWGWNGGSPNYESFANDLLPCAHDQKNSPNLHSLTTASSLTKNGPPSLACKVCCTKVILSEANLRLLRLLRERKRRACFLTREGFWNRLEQQQQQQQPTAGPLELVFDMPSAFLLREALQHALPSIRVPESACPRMLRWVTNEDIPGAILGFLQRMHGLRRMDFSGQRTSVGGLEGSLMQTFEECLGEVQAGRGEAVTGVRRLPEEYVSLLRLWIVRAVRLVLIPGYDGRGVAAVFGDGGEGLVGTGVGEVMDELEGLLRGARLE
jgi:hypothetical protein